MFTPYDLYQQPFKIILGLLIVAIWEIIWKGIALWHAARETKKGWFIAILIVNSLGILPIIYLIWFKQKKEKTVAESDTTSEEAAEEKPKAKKSSPRKKKSKKVEKEEQE